MSRAPVPWTESSRLAVTLGDSVFLAALLSGLDIAGSAYPSAFFRVTMVALALAGVNALVYHHVTERTVKAWDDQVRLPLEARLAGRCSLTLWVAAILWPRDLLHDLLNARSF